MESNGRTIWRGYLPLVTVILFMMLEEQLKRLIATRLINKKEPILPDMIKKLVEASNLYNLLNLRNVCILLLAFAVFFFRIDPPNMSIAQSRLT